MLLLDEPLGALDKKLREETQFELMDLQQELGMTFIVVTHDQEEAMIMSDRIAVMDNGEIIQIASPAEIMSSRQPLCRGFHRRYHHYRRQGRERWRRPGEDRQQRDRRHPYCRFRSGGFAGQTVWLAVRPEKVTIDFADVDGGGSEGIAGSISDIGYLGKWTTFKVKTAVASG